MAPNEPTKNESSEVEREQPWKKWITEEVAAREAASQTEKGKEEQETRRANYEEQMTEQERTGGTGAGNKSG